MSVNRPGFKANLKANLDSAKVDKLFIDVPKESSILVRPLPANKVNGEIWHMVANHYKLKDEKEKDRGIAIADLSVHGTDETGRKDYINELVAVLEKFGDSNEKKIAESIKSSSRWYMQVLLVEKTDSGLKYTGPKLLSVPRTGVNAVNEIMKASDMSGEPDMTDADKGFNIMITRHKATPWYTAQRAGSPIALDDVVPTWVDTFIKDVDEKLNIKLFTYDQQREAVMRTFGDELDFEALEKHGL